MNNSSNLDPSHRQVLVNLGNRYVVFGPSSGLPQPIAFSPDTDAELLPRVEDEGEAAEQRIVQTLRVAGMRRAPDVHERKQADLALLDEAGHKVLVEVKVRERDPKKRDYDQGREFLAEAARTGEASEVWFFNIERLKLVIMYFDRSKLLHIDELIPLDVWSKADDGVFKRERVVNEVEDWVHRLEALYENVSKWLSNLSGLRCERTRTVVMSEEMMQQFAVTDREIPVLDVIDANQVVASFVPRGLWLIGAWGRVDIITPERTRVLLALRNSAKELEWRLVSPEGRRHTEPFSKDALLALVKRP